MRVVVWVAEPGWPAAVDAANQIAGPDADVELVHVVDDTQEVVHGAFAGLFGRGQHVPATVDQQAMTTAQELAQVARERLLKADKTLRAKVLALLDVRVTITENGDLVKVRLEGSLAHDLLLAEVRDDLAPRKLASTPLE